MENLIYEIVTKYFAAENIESVKVFNGRAIITLCNVPEDDVKANEMKAEIAGVEGVKKVNVVYTAEKKVAPLQEGPEKWQLAGVKKIIGVASGKGGVGKSTTAVNLALALANLGLKTALFDADIYGPSIPTMLGYEGVPPISFDGQSFQPFDYMNIASMSIGSLIDRSQPLIWRGSKACGALEQLLTETNWGEIDVMVIDMPPGTGDIQLTLSQRLTLDGVIIVSTPQDIALIDAVKGVNMFKRVDVPILGIVENMSYYVCEKCGTRADIFGHAGAQETAKDLGVDFLGEIPLHLSIRQNADNGTPIVMAEPESPHTKAYETIAAKIKTKLGL